MTRHLILRVIAATSFSVVPASLTFGIPTEPISEIGQSFLQKAAESQQAEVALGQLAVQKASNVQVKHYGAHMIQDHQKASDEVGQLLTKEGTPLPSQLSMEHQQVHQNLSQLTGKDFDKAYISFMVRDHMKDLGQLEQGAQTLTDPQVKQWTAATLPILKDHLEQANAIAAMIGVNAG
jgi:putative membrane protein